MDYLVDRHEQTRCTPNLQAAQQQAEELFIALADAGGEKNAVVLEAENADTALRAVLGGVVDAQLAGLAQLVGGVQGEQRPMLLG